MDTIVEGNVYINNKFEKCCIGIEKGKIKKIKKNLKGDKHFNFGRKIILPAGVDLHVHFRDPGLTNKEDFFTGSLSAVFGGISCVFDMPNTKPETTTVRSLVEKTRNIQRKSLVDFGLYSAITNNNLKNITELSKHCHGFKIFLGDTTGSIKIDEKYLKQTLAETNKLNKVTFFHAENQKCLDAHKREVKNLKEHLKRRPSECEEIAIKIILDSVKQTNSKIHICHLSSIDGYELIKNQQNNISTGVTPHHLFFDIKNTKLKDTFYKVNPPIRSNYDRESLWQGIKNGIINILESDHAPHTQEEKRNDFNTAPSGIPGVETMYPLFLAAVKNDQLSFQRLISLICENPAKIMKIPKGRIQTGYDADIITIDFDNLVKIKADKLHYKCGWTPFEDFKAIFPSDVFIRGQKVVENSELIVNKGFGEKVNL